MSAIGFLLQLKAATILRDRPTVKSEDRLLYKLQLEESYSIKKLAYPGKVSTSVSNYRFRKYRLREHAVAAIRRCSSFRVRLMWRLWTKCDSQLPSSAGVEWWEQIAGDIAAATRDVLWSRVRTAALYEETTYDKRCKLYTPAPFIASTAQPSCAWTPGYQFQRHEISNHHRRRLVAADVIGAERGGS